jgi:hypothetical protein
VSLQIKFDLKVAIKEVIQIALRRNAKPDRIRFIRSQGYFRAAPSAVKVGSFIRTSASSAAWRDYLHGAA